MISGKGRGQKTSKSWNDGIPNNPFPTPKSAVISLVALGLFLGGSLALAGGYLWVAPKIQDAFSQITQPKIAVSENSEGQSQLTNLKTKTAAAAKEHAARKHAARAHSSTQHKAKHHK